MTNISRKMLLSLRCLVICLCCALCYSQVTLRKNRLLSRKRRYLFFPEGSNFVPLELSYVKSLLRSLPACIIPSSPGMNVNQNILLFEIDRRGLQNVHKRVLLQITMSFIKSVMVKVPKLVNVLGECDVPFKLPSDPGVFRKKKLHHRMHYRQRREVYSQLEDALTTIGLDGNACVKRMICDAELHLPTRGKSLVTDILSAIFTFSVGETHDDKFHNYCHNSTYQNCEVPLLEYIMGSVIK